MTSIKFPHNLYGLPLSGVALDTDSTLFRTTVMSGWVRQRKNYLHAPTTVTVSFRMTLSMAHSCINWLQTYTDDWFLMQMISGNDDLSPYDVYFTEVKRKSAIAAERIYGTNMVVLTFAIDFRELVGYEAEAAAPLIKTYPVTLPLPTTTGYSSSHADRNLTTYGLTFRMNTAMLKAWLRFALFSGVSWFKMHWPTENTAGCGDEYIRFISNPRQSLVGPNLWEVSISAETIPAHDLAAAPPPVVIENYIYEYDIDYDQVS